MPCRHEEEVRRLKNKNRNAWRKYYEARSEVHSINANIARALAPIAPFLGKAAIKGLISEGDTICKICSCSIVFTPLFPENKALYPCPVMARCGHFLCGSCIRNWGSQKPCTMGCSPETPAFAKFEIDMSNSATQKAIAYYFIRSLTESGDFEEGVGELRGSEHFKELIARFGVFFDGGPEEKAKKIIEEVKLTDHFADIQPSAVARINNGVRAMFGAAQVADQIAEAKKMPSIEEVREIIAAAAEKRREKASNKRRKRPDDDEEDGEGESGEEKDKIAGLEVAEFSAKFNMRPMKSIYGGTKCANCNQKMTKGDWIVKNKDCGRWMHAKHVSE